VNEAIEDPWALLRRLKLGREEFCQRLLTMLILEAAYPRWNTRSIPSKRGVQFLRRLDELCFGGTDVDEEALFVDELELVSRDGAEPGCAPDYAVLSTSRIWIIELKTEAASHRANQIPDYFAYAQHHHPDLSVDITYLSPPYRGSALQAPDGSRFAHVTWDDVLPLVDEVWGRSGRPHENVADALAQAISGGDERWSGWRATRTDDPVATGLDVARRTDADGRQRAIDHPFATLEELEAARIELRDALVETDSQSRPWVWRAATSGGDALTATGTEHGYELRVSRYSSP
jgi:hypothetical protein